MICLISKNDLVMPIDKLKKMSVSKLLSTHSSIMDELRRRNIIRTYNNPVSDYTEWLVSSKLKLSLSQKSQAGYDAIDERGKRYQIKGRRSTELNKSRQLGVIRDLDAKKFDYLVGVILNSDYSVKYAALIPHRLVSKLSKYSNHQNGHLLHLREKVLSERGVKDITDKLKG